MICMKRHVLENSSRRVCRYLLILSSRASVKREGDVCYSKVWAFPLSLYFILGVAKMSSFHGSFLFPSVSLSPSDLRGGGTVDHTSHVMAKKRREVLD